MASRKITLVVVPEGPRKIRQIKIPRFWVFSVVLVFLAGSVSLAWVVRDYLSIKRDLPRLSSLQEENTMQKQQITSLSGKVEAINLKMAELNEFDRKVRDLVSLDPSRMRRPSVSDCWTGRNRSSHAPLLCGLPGAG